MTTETGPIYGVPLIEFLPIGEMARQQMPSHDDLLFCKTYRAKRVAAGYEVLLAHYHRVCEERDRLKALLKEIDQWDQDYPSLSLGHSERIAKELDT